MDPNARPLRAILTIIVAVAAVTLLGQLLRPREKVPWRDDLAAARNEARQGGKPVFAYFTAHWCVPCQRLRRTTWADGMVADALRDGYLPVKVDVDAHPNLAEQYEIRSVPVFIVLDPSGSVVKRAEGTMEPQRFLAWLKS